MLNTLLNQEFGRYVITALLGRGGMAAVYRAHDRLLQRDVAIKLLYPQYVHDQTIIERFKREAITAAALEHPHIGPIYDVGEQDGMVYIAMKLLEGRSLQDVLHELGTLSLAELLPVLEQVASALDYAHSRGVIHRDIKPGNILLDLPADAGQPPRVSAARAILTDFGIAKTLDTPGLTTTGALIGTPDYMAPEQISNRFVDGRADIYALGMLAFRALTGRRAFDGGAQDVLMGHLYKQPPAPSALNPQLSPAVDAVLLKSLAKNPDERYATASAFVQDLRRAHMAAATATSVPAPVIASRSPAVATPVGAPPLPAAAPVPPPRIAMQTQTAPRTAADPKGQRAPTWIPVVAGLAMLILLFGIVAALWRDGSGTANPEPTPGLPTSEPGLIIPIPTDIPTATVEEITPESPTSAPTEATTEMPPVAEPTAPPAATALPVDTTVPPGEPTPAPPPPPTATPPPPPTATPPPPPTATPPPDTPTNMPEPPTVTSTPEPEPTVIPTSTPDPAALLEGGFGKLYGDNPLVRAGLGYPLAPQQLGEAVVQFFEGGTMYWWSWKNDDTPKDVIYVILDMEGGDYLVLEREAVVKYPEPIPDPDIPVPMQGGFARVYYGIPSVREALGAPLGPESYLDPHGVRQFFEHGLMLFIPARTDPNNANKLIFVLYEDNTFVRYNDTYPD